MLRKLCSAVAGVACWTGFLGASERARPVARVLMYHGVPSAMRAQFEREMRLLRRQFDVAPLAEVVEALQSDAPLEPQVALTFDDGLRNNVEVAYPILRALELPATFFACPSLAEEGRWLWNHEARQRLLRLDAAVRERFAADAGAPAGGVESLIDWMKSLPLARRREIESRIRARTARFQPTAEEKDCFDLASLEALRRLDPAIVTIGAHTLTHAILPPLSAQDCEREVGDSRRVLEGALGRAVDLFAYPNGDLNDAVLACVRRHYRAAVSTVHGWAARGCDLHLIPRAAAPQGALRLARFLSAPSEAPGAPLRQAPAMP